MMIFFGQAEVPIPEEAVTVDWVGLLLTIGLCVCPVAIIVVGIILAIVISKRKRKPPE